MDDAERGQPMSDVMAMDHAASQAGQTAAMALQVLVMAARALREYQQREAAKAASWAPDPVRDRYAKMVRDTVQPAAVAEAMVNAPLWPKVADELRKLEAAGVDVTAFLRQAAPVIARIDADLRAGSATPGVTATAAATTPRNPYAPPGQEPAKRDGPNLIERTVDAVKKLVQKLTGRGPGEAGARPVVSVQENILAVVTAREALADEKLVSALVNSAEWPGIAGQAKALRDAGHNPREALAGVPVRMQQAQAVGIDLSPAEAARGLLNEQAKTPAPSRAAESAAALAPSSTPGTAPSPPATTAGPSPAPARAAAATTRSPIVAEAPTPKATSVAESHTTYKWAITVPGETNAEEIASGKFQVPAGPNERDAVKAMAGEQLRSRVPEGIPDYRAREMVISAVGPDGWRDAVRLRGDEARQTSTVKKTAAAATATSTTAEPGAAPAAGPEAARATPAARPQPAHKHSR